MILNIRLERCIYVINILFSALLREGQSICYCSLANDTKNRFKRRTCKNSVAVIRFHIKYIFNNSRCSMITIHF